MNGIDVDHAIYYLEMVGLHHDAAAVKAEREELISVRAQLSEAQADRDFWEQMASVRLNEAIAAMRCAEAAEKERIEAYARLAETECEAFAAGFRRGTQEGKHGAAPVSPAAQVAQVAQGVADAVVRDYPEGWIFHSADFSMAASCPARSGRVTLVRDLAGRDWWLALSDEDKERVPLYVYGSGNTLSDAIKDAAMLAAQQQKSHSGPCCPSCGATEVDAMTPWTVYGCGSKDYDQRPGTFKQSDTCAAKQKAGGA